jgi:uncharacterized protein (TIGR02217 family)
MDFLEDPPFPVCPSFGFTSEPMYRVTVVTTSGGQERRNRHWSRPLHRYTASVNPRGQEEVAEVLRFWHAVNGRAIGFRFKDFVDFKSSSIEDPVSFLDQPLSVQSLSANTYQLVKNYTVGALTQSREIFKPIAGTILLASGGTELTEGADWTLDASTGIVTLSVPASGTLSWGGEFHVPVRFDSEFPVEIVNKQIQGCQFMLMELRLVAEDFTS